MADVESGGASIGCGAECTQLMDDDRNLQNSAAENGDYILKAHGHILSHLEKLKVVRTKDVCH